ncbi:LTA synthase family protein [Aurantibacillus circumpalustris]|uniref:LTA synthase family protein n=1 Tax=Aurantibacillus circumpalustris TaxID=3036359 RepID=UPI00295B1C47|nr:sulfatase-like hydrolase/transferase [Aurantibacillus circumpalustris]
MAYFVCRLFFYFSNIGYFQTVNTFDLIADCFYGLRTDSFSIVVSNSLFILLSILPSNFFSGRPYQILLKSLFVICNTVFIAVNCIDIAYFPFIRKRSSADLFKQMGGQSDMSKLIPQFLKDFWWAVLFFVAIIVVLVYFYNRIKLKPIITKYSFSKPKQWALITLMFVLSAGFGVLAVRGGLQRVPITIVEAGSVTSIEEVPIVLNTPFTIIKSMEVEAIAEYNFYSPDELKSIYNPVRHYKDSEFKKQNVVVLILESFAKEYTKLGRISYTPFLDSLMDHSLVCSNAFSNGSKSIEGIPAILSSLPTFMENPFINSLYALNDQTSIASILSAEGYQTAFFHGGINGTMNFDSWASLAGYQAYYGKNEYNDNSDFDDFWGIWDEPFLKYSVKKMNSFKQPFHTAIFTLSSHHPYKIPEKYKNKFPKGDLENSESIGYADYSLKQFFNAAKKTDWYNNTLFVLTADHGSVSKHPFYTNVVGNQGIPILFFVPDNLLKKDHKKVFSQMDILPSVMDLLGYNRPFFSFGESFRSKEYGNDYFYASSTEFLFNDSMLYCFKMPILSATYQYTKDSTLSQPITGKYNNLDSIELHRSRAFFQTYNSTLIHNTGKLK